MSRFARQGRVFFFEEPVFQKGPAHIQKVRCPVSGVIIVTPTLAEQSTDSERVAVQRELLLRLIADEQLTEYCAWYYTPMAMEFTSVLDPVLTVYDCMDELTGFAGAPLNLRANESALLAQADLVFTGGASLYAAKRDRHSAVQLFPSSVDAAHFAAARTKQEDPADQRSIGHPRLGYAGVIDERMDLDLVHRVCEARPEWQLILLGPVAKIAPESIPALPNLHLLGMKKYEALPQYLSGWEIGMLPFALNEATRFISPTKTPEYLAAGLRVISTPIRDVVSPYGELGLVSIAAGPDEFIAAAEAMLKTPPPAAFREQVDDFLRRSSWDKTWSEMEQLMRSEWGSKRVLPLTASGVKGVSHV